MSGHGSFSAIGGGGSNSGYNSWLKNQNWFNDDNMHSFEITIRNGSKEKKELFYGTTWQVMEKEQNYIENTLGMTYSKYLQQSKHSYNPVQILYHRTEYGDAVKADNGETYQEMIKSGTTDKDSVKHAIKEYEKRKKEFARRHYDWTR